MRAIILAAGQGTRLRPYTADRPKPLVELGGRSLLDRTTETLRATGVDDQIVVTGYEASKIERAGHETVHNSRYDETEMVYSLFTAEDEFPDGDDLLVSYGDILYDSSVVRALIECDAEICVVIDREWRALWETRFEDPLDDAETLRLDTGMNVIEIGQEASSYDDIEGQYIGLFKISGDAMDAFAEVYKQINHAEATADRTSGLEMTTFLQQLIARGWQIKAVPIERGWLEVDTVADLETYRSLLDENRLSQFIQLAE